MPAQAKHHRGSHDDEGTVGDMPAYDSELFRISRYVHLAVVKTRDAPASRAPLPLRVLEAADTPGRPDENGMTTQLESCVGRRIGGFPWPGPMERPTPRQQAARTKGRRADC